MSTRRRQTPRGKTNHDDYYVIITRKIQWKTETIIFMICA